MKTIDSVRAFLSAKTKTHNGPDLLERYLQFPSLETQINVAAGKGEAVAGKRSTYTDGIDEWFSIRIGDAERAGWHQKFPLDLHAEAIGCTGWDWSAQCSRFVGFDFDTIAGHAAGVGVTDAELERVREAACNIPWVEVRRSTSGGGLHLYVIFSEGIPTNDHDEHAALGRAVLNLMSRETGFNFARHVDACGGNMWIWARKMTVENQGLSLVKAAEQTLADVPDFAPSPPATDCESVELTESHRADIKRMQAAGFVAQWGDGMLLGHSRGFEVLGRGGYRTTSPGREPQSPNCFAFPKEDGGWIINRYETKPEAEAPGWTANSKGCAMFRMLAPDDLETTAAPVSTSQLPIFAAADLMTTYSKPRDAVIPGLIQEGDTINLIAPPKLRKSFWAMQLACSIAHGLPFLGREVVQGRVLLIDNELHKSTLSARLKAMSEALGIKTITGLDVLPLRGQLASLATIRSELLREPKRYSLVVIDALYKVLAGADENSNSDMAGIYATLDEIAEKHGCAVVVVHHASKGAQHAKSVSDSGSGAGVQSRSADVHLVLRQHEDPDTVVLSAIVRNQKPIEPQCLEFRYPLWYPAPDKSTITLAVAGKKPVPTLEEFLDSLSTKPKPLTTELDRIRRAIGATVSVIAALKDGAVSQGLIEITKASGANKPRMIRRLPAKSDAAVDPTPAEAA